MSLRIQALQTLVEMAEKQRAQIMDGKTLRDLKLHEIKEVNRLNEKLNTYRAGIQELTEDDGFVTMYPDLRDYE